ncbi:MAG: hypothetical protein Q4F99_06780, partial [bacterium]|nr:hypothetical protein [bacterium]
TDKHQAYSLCLDKVLEMPEAETAKEFDPVVIFNSSAEYENEGSNDAFVPTWPKDTSKTVEWTLPPFATILFEVTF